MKIKYFLFASLISTFISCNNHQNKDAFKKEITSININPDNTVDLHLSEIIDSLTYIPLETTQDSYMKNIDKLIYYKDDLYILDKSTKAIYCFSKDGKFLYKIRRVGKGPGEYIEIADFLINPFRERLEILDRRSRKITCYNILNKEFDEDIIINHLANNFIVTDPHSYFLYTMGSGFFNGENDYKYNLLQVDFKGKNVLGQYCEAYEGSTNYGFPSMLPRINDTTALFSCFYNDTIYEISKNLIYPKYYIDFGNHKLPLKAAKLSTDQRKNFKKDPYAYSLNTFFETNEILYFQYLYKSKFRKVIYYKNNGAMINFNYMINNDIDGIPLDKVETISRNNMLFSIEALRLQKFIKNDIRVDGNIKHFLNNIKPDNNPIIVMGKLK